MQRRRIAQVAELYRRIMNAVLPNRILARQSWTVLQVARRCFGPRRRLHDI